MFIFTSCGEEEKFSYIIVKAPYCNDCAYTISTMYVSGEIKNTSQKDCSYAQITIAVMIGDLQIATVYDNTDYWGANSTWRFEAMGTYNLPERNTWFDTKYVNDEYIYYKYKGIELTYKIVRLSVK